MRSDFIEVFERWMGFEDGVKRALLELRGVVQNDPPPGWLTAENIAAWETKAEVLKAKILTNFDRRVEETLAVLRSPAPPAPFGGFDD